MNIDFSVPAPLKMQAYNIVKRAIITGAFKDDDAITERLVLERFKISRTPFREAIQILESEGWVYTIQYKGTYVKPVTLKDIDELFQLRKIIEPGIIELLIETGKEQETARQLEIILNKMSKEEKDQSDFDFMSLDREFHSLLYDLTDNSRIRAFSEQISDMMLRVGIRVLNRKSRREEVIDEHRRIIEGLKDGTAKVHLKSHLDETKESFIEMYKEVGSNSLKA